MKSATPKTSRHRFPRREKSLGFFNCWTRKEAFIKALGDGFNFPLDRFDVSVAPGEPAKILRVGSTSGRLRLAHGEFSPAPGFVAAMVTERRECHTDFALRLACAAKAR